MLVRLQSRPELNGQIFELVQPVVTSDAAQVRLHILFLHVFCELAARCLLWHEFVARLACFPTPCWVGRLRHI